MGLSGWQRRRGERDDQGRPEVGQATGGAASSQNEGAKVFDERDPLIRGSQEDDGEAVHRPQSVNTGGRFDRSAAMLRQSAQKMFANILLPGTLGVNEPSDADAIYQAPEHDIPPSARRNEDLFYDVPGHPQAVRGDQVTDCKPVIPTKRRGKKAVVGEQASFTAEVGARRKQITPQDLNVEHIRLKPIPRRSRRLNPVGAADPGEDVQDILQPLRQPERGIEPPGGVWLTAVSPASNLDSVNKVQSKPPTVDSPGATQLAVSAAVGGASDEVRDVAVGGASDEVRDVAPPVGFRETAEAVQSITITPVLGRRLAGGTRLNPVISVPSNVFNEAVRSLHGSVAGR